MLRCLLALMASALLQAAAPVFIPLEEVGDLPAKISPMEWPAWVATRDAEIRARLARGDEDSLVYLWLFGTSFTKQPRATAEQLARLADPAKGESLLIDRLEDLVAALSSPAAARNERLQVARAYLASKGLSLATEAGRLQAKEYLVRARERVVAENADFRRATDAARKSADPTSAQATYATLYRDRGLSTDTRLTASYAIHKAVAAAARERLLASDSVRRAAIVGPGLDFVDKAEGYDFYPVQTIQPFALIESLMQARLLKTSEFELTTYDVSARVNAHLAGAVKRAAEGTSYRLQLPRPIGDPAHQWQPDLIAYWQSLGGLMGREAIPVRPPAGSGGVRVRAIAVSPLLVRRIVPRDLDIIVQREPRGDAERFDLIVATNVLVYYDAFEQAMALANIASMLRPGGIFLTNYEIAPSDRMDAVPQLTTRVFFDQQGNGDSVFCYRRR